MIMYCSYLRMIVNFLHFGFTARVWSKRVVTKTNREKFYFGLTNNVLIIGISKWSIFNVHVPYTNFKYISMYLDDILQGVWNINVTSKVFKVQPTIKRSRFHPYGRTHKTMYYTTMFYVSIFTFEGIGEKAAILDFSHFYDCNYVLM